jgi:mycothiol S-conjugate amidase
MQLVSERCVILAVYAHPDDETIHWGGTLARYAAAGVRVVCASATRGELGEIVDPLLATPRNFERLGEIRMDEMARAVAILGPIEIRWLGYRDSGTDGDPRTDDPEAFCRADPDEAAGRVARLIREVRPQVVITHKGDGGDGHPDHRHAALITHLAFERSGDPDAWPEQLVGTDALHPWAPAKLYELQGRTLAPLSRRTKFQLLVRRRGLLAALPVIARAILRLRPQAEQAVPPANTGQVKATTRIDVGPWVTARDAAIRVYRTQVAPSDELLAMPPDVLHRLSPTEDYRLWSSPSVTVQEDDLFAGLDCVRG